MTLAFLAGLAVGALLWACLGVLTLRGLTRWLDLTCPACGFGGPAAFDAAFLEAVATLQPEASGLAVRKHMALILGRPVSLFAVYEAAERAEAAGQVTSRQEPGGPERGGRPRRFWEVAQ